MARVKPWAVARALGFVVCYGSGIVINHAPAAVVVTDNVIRDIRSSGVPTPNERYGIFVSTSGNVGRIFRNEIAGTDDGVRLRHGNSGVIVGDNRMGSSGAAN